MWFSNRRYIGKIFSESKGKGLICMLPPYSWPNNMAGGAFAMFPAKSALKKMFDLAPRNFPERRFRHFIK
jgi:hypothetical protein